MKGLFKLVLGLAFFVLFLLLLTYKSWLWSVIELVQGGVMLALVLISVVLVLLGITELRENEA